MKLYLPVLLTLLLSVDADLRLASQPRKKYHVRTRRGARPFIPKVAQYFEPDTFGYQGLKNQKAKNYDNFLRSNIDNEQDKRHFFTERGRDHLPFRTFEGGKGHVLNITKVQVGVETIVPLRWNNPHASELEVNIWIHRNNTLPVVVPIRKPACSGEGHQDNAFTYIIPNDFNKLASKIPGFTGCNKMGECTLQIYAHSVESRTYAIGIPIRVPGFDASVPKATDESQIQPAAVDPGTDLSKLRELCLSSADPSVHIKSAVPQKARLVSDQYNHAYQDSDYSPYSGQQHESISRNMQAACILKMVTSNKGELGRSILSGEERRLRARHRKRVNSLIKQYESIANKFINLFGNRLMKTTAPVAHGQKLANCFRCAEVGGTNPRRLETNTYIPSYQVRRNLIDRARGLIPGSYRNILTSSGVMQIYVGVLEAVSPNFANLAKRGLAYQPAKVKGTMGTMWDKVNFRKINPDQNRRQDAGQYAARYAKKVQEKEEARQARALALIQQTPTALGALLADDEEEDVMLPDSESEAVTVDPNMDGNGDDEECESDFVSGPDCDDCTIFQNATEVPEECDLAYNFGVEAFDVVAAGSVVVPPLTVTATVTTTVTILLCNSASWIFA